MSDYANVVPKGVTRPAMWWGIPIPPLFAGVFAVGAFATMTHIFAIGLLLPVLLIMRQVTATDPQMWRLIGLWLLFRVVYFDFNWMHWRSSTYAPIKHRRA